MPEGAQDVAAVPLAKLRPAPWNPRTIRDERFKTLCRSIESDPEFLWRRPVLAMADGTIYAGNMRFRAAEHLGLDTIPAVVEDIPEDLAKQRALRDNNTWGEWDEDALGDLLQELPDVELLGFDEAELDWFGAGAEREGVQGGDTPAPGKKAESYVRLVVAGADIRLVERALRATGQGNRATALATICRAYLSEDLLAP
jgi:hypothetical protein